MDWSLDTMMGKSFFMDRAVPGLTLQYIAIILGVVAGGILVTIALHPNFTQVNLANTIALPSDSLLTHPDTSQLATAQMQDAVHVPLRANFTMDMVTSRGEVRFSDTSTGNPVLWYWDFGDGSVSNEQNAVHTFTAAGPHTVTLLVMNDPGEPSQISYDCIPLVEPVSPMERPIEPVIPQSREIQTDNPTGTEGSGTAPAGGASPQTDTPAPPTVEPTPLPTDTPAPPTVEPTPQPTEPPEPRPHHTPKPHKSSKD